MLREEARAAVYIFNPQHAGWNFSTKVLSSIHRQKAGNEYTRKCMPENQLSLVFHDGES